MNFAEAIVFDEASPDHVYMALRNGDVYASENCGDSWMKLDVKAPGVADMKCVAV
jgi:hypothetical protein